MMTTIEVKYGHRSAAAMSSRKGQVLSQMQRLFAGAFV